MTPPPSLRAATAKQVWIGIDPGMLGAIAAINERGEFLWIYDMPITHLGRTGEFDLETMATIARQVTRYPEVHVILEWVQTRPDEAPESSKRFGVGLGMLEMAFTMVGHRPERVSPNKWKGRLSLTGKADNALKSREQSVSLAEAVIQRLPSGTLRGVRGGLKDGRAEALLIAWEALTGTLEGLRAQPENIRWMRILDSGGGKRNKRLRGMS